PTGSGYLKSMADFLQIDEYDFFGNDYDDVSLSSDVTRLRYRQLPERALVITPRTLADNESAVRWSANSADFISNDQKSREKARRFFDAVRQRAFHFARKEGALGLRSEDIIIDIPKPPTSTKLGEGILVEIVSGYVVPLSELFPFEKVVKNYSKH